MTPTRLRALAWSRGESLADVAARHGVAPARLVKVPAGSPLARRLEAEFGEPIARLLAPVELPTDPRTRAALEPLVTMLARAALEQLRAEDGDDEAEEFEAARGA